MIEAKPLNKEVLWEKENGEHTFELFSARNKFYLGITGISQKESADITYDNVVPQKPAGFCTQNDNGTCNHAYFLKNGKALTQSLKLFEKHFPEFAGNKKDISGAMTTVARLKNFMGKVAESCKQIGQR